MKRLVRTLLASGVLVLLGSSPALADPPGPTDYLSEVAEIDPPVAGIEIEIIGGDSFVLLTVEAGVAVDVVGYAGEPYLRFLADGTVKENRLAPSKYLNEDRYGITEMPDDADPEAPPEWIVVAGDGSYAWHDHRTHWMNDVPPPNRGPGDQVAEGVVPLLVDGREVDVTVVSFWQEPPSRVPIVLGFVAGLAVAVATLRRGPRGLAVSVLGMSIVAMVVGGTAYWSTPAETAPPWSLWVLPATAIVFALAAIFGGSRVAGRERILLLIASLELVGWGIAHWDWLWPAVLPTSLPFWLDRFLSVLVLTGALGATAAVLIAAAAPDRRVLESR